MPGLARTLTIILVASGAVASGQTSSARPARPDLLVVQVGNPATQVVAGDVLRLPTRIQNKGSARAGRSTVAYFLSRNQRKDAADLRLTAALRVPALGPGSTFTGRARLTIPGALPSGSYYLVGCADGSRRVSEAKESNNCRASSRRTRVVGAPGGSLAEQVLTLRQRRPTDVDLFTSQFTPGPVDGLYPQAATMQPATGPTLSEAEVRQQLSAFLDDWYAGDVGKKNAALALYDGGLATAMIPEPENRAAFVCLAGTIWGPVVDHYLTSGLFTFSRYGGLPITVFARSALVDGKFQVIFNTRHRSEDFRTKIGLWLHEINHDDAPVTGDEESVLHALTAMAHLQVLLRSPDLAYDDTELTRVMNSYALQFINSREHGSPTSEIVAPTGDGTAPGSALSKVDFRAVIGGTSGDTPAPAALRQILARLGLPTTPQYGDTMTESFAGLNDAWLSDQGRVQVSVLMQLVSVGDISQATGLSASSVITALDLQPYLDAIED